MSPVNKRLSRSTAVVTLRDAWRMVAAEVVRNNAPIVIGLLRQTSTEDHAIRDYHLILRGLGEPSS